MYLYFDSKGTLLETINDEAIRQYNVGVNTINVFIEDANAPDSGKIPWDIYSLLYRFQLADGTLVSTSDGENITIDYTVSRDNGDLKKKKIPFNINRDLKHFKYGKEYEFFVIDVPCGRISELADRQEQNTVNFVSEGDVFKRGGVVLMTIQAAKTGSRFLSLERVAFTVENAVMLPDEAVNSSEFNWLLQQYIIGDYLRPQLVYGAVDVITAEHDFVIEGNVYKIDLSLTTFNRQPLVGEKVLYIYRKDISSLYPELYKTFAVLAEIDSINEDDSIASISFLEDSKIDIRGSQGHNILYYGAIQRISGNIEIGMNINLIKANINVPLDFLDYDFIGDDIWLFFTKDYINYLGICSISNYIESEGRVMAKLEKYIRLTGETGATGATGATGPQGKEGTTFIPRVVDGTLSWTNSDGKVNPSSAYIRGPEGPTGAKITKTELVSETSSGNKYKQTFDNGTTAEFIAPKGPQGADGTTFTPHVSENGIISWMNTDGKKNPTAVNIKGPVGTTFTPSVSSDGVISWTNNGGLDNPNEVNIRGPKGANGRTYIPSVSEGGVISWTVGEPTSIPDAVDIRGPRGFTGETGPQGTQGERGNRGDSVTNVVLKTTEYSEEYSKSTIQFITGDGVHLPTVEIPVKNGIEPNCISFTDSVAPSVWVETSTYSSYGYNYQAVLHYYGSKNLYPIETYVPEVIPTDIGDIMSTNFAPFAESTSVGIAIFAKEKPTTTKTFNVSLTHAIANE